MRALIPNEFFNIKGGVFQSKKTNTEPPTIPPSLGAANGRSTCLGGAGCGGPSSWSVVRPPSEEFF